MHNFKELTIWKNSKEYCVEIYTITKLFPSEERFGLVSQINRSAVSIPSNITEGSSRNSQKEFSRFIQIALGSSFELETQLMISYDLGFIKKSDFTETIQTLNKIQ